MGFLQELVAALPSIATTIAPLFNAKKNDYLKYSLHDSQSVYFKKDEKGEICCYNPFHEPISLVFPNKNGVGGESVNIDRSAHFPVTHMLTEHAKSYVDDFQIEKGGVEPNHNNVGIKNGLMTATISASGKIPNGNNTTKIGTSLFAKIEDEDLCIQVVPPYNLEGILDLEISGDRNEPCRLFKNTQNDGSTPTPVMQGNIVSTEMRFLGALSTFKDSNNIFVSVAARCSYNSNELPHDTVYHGVLTTEKDWEFLKTGRCLNE